MEMEMEVKDELTIAVERLAAAADALELAAEKIAGVQVSAAVDQVAELESKLREAEAMIAGLRAEGLRAEGRGETARFEGRKTLPAGVVSLLAKHGDEGVDRAGLDAALVGLSMEQRIAVKAQLLRSGLVG